MLGAIILQYFSGTFLYKFFKAFTREEEDVYCVCTCTSIPSPKILSGGTTVLLGQIFSILEETLRGFFSPLGKNVKLRKNFSCQKIIFFRCCDAKD